MDDFEKDFPDFNWRNVPAYKHPRGKDCPCPKHEYIREQINVAKAISNNNREITPDHRQKAQVTLKLCPDHYNVYFDGGDSVYAIKIPTHDQNRAQNWSNSNSKNPIYAIRPVFLL